jgi:hypothetical protein
MTTLDVSIRIEDYVILLILWKCNQSKINLLITKSIMEIFLTLPHNNYSKPIDHFKWLGQKHLTNSEELMQTSGGCKGLSS